MRLLFVAEHLDLSNQLVADLLATIDTAKQIKYLEPSLFSDNCLSEFTSTSMGESNKKDDQTFEMGVKAAMNESLIE